MERPSTSWVSGSSDQLQWLKTTLLDVDERVKDMLKFTEDDCVSLDKEPEMYYQISPEFRQLFEELRRSYCSLAANFDRLKSKSTHIATPIHSSSISRPKEIQHQTRVDSSLIITSDPDDKYNIDGQESLNKLAVDLKQTELHSMNVEDRKAKKISKTDDGAEKMNGSKLGQNMVGNFPSGTLDWEKAYSEMHFQVMNLVEENLQQQEELVRRNNDKRQIIKEIRSKQHRLTSENRALKSCLMCSKSNAKQKQSQISKLKAIILGWLWVDSP